MLKIEQEQLAGLRAAAEAAYQPGVFWYQQDMLERFTRHFTGAELDAAYIAAASPAAALALFARIEELERDSARLDYMIDNGLFVEAFIMPDLPKMPPTCWLVDFKTGPIGREQFEDPRAAIDAAMGPACPRHPPSIPQ